MDSSKQIGTKTIIVDGKECTVRVFEPAVPKPKKKNEVRSSQTVQERNDDDWSIENRMSSDSTDLPSKAFGRRSRHEERHREEDER